ncbi:hypothetical protein NDU88_006562 [Pleurodeles waltl]|uniref:Uncharacterized protein n=1 Tax=Pleurodeles waltl TaxID=8319 RepID=A0AAV7TX67_PLEWA|nr:hypothetical protein NDU88_006562 [Pleurodeles waltl]
MPCRRTLTSERVEGIVFLKLRQTVTPSTMPGPRYNRMFGARAPRLHRCPANRSSDGRDRAPEGCRQGRSVCRTASRLVAAALGGPATRPPGLDVEGSGGVRGAAAVSARGSGRLDE